MKQVITFSILFFTLIACGEKEDIDNDPGNQNEDYYDCTDFFLTGDYSDFCTVNTPLVNLIDSTIDGGGTICRYIFPALDPSLGENTGVYFTSLETTTLAQTFFENRRIYSDTTSQSDSLRFHTEIEVDGYEAYVSESTFANYGKTITTRYKNCLVTVAVVYYYDWYPTPPCNYSTSELTALLSDVLANM